MKAIISMLSQLFFAKGSFEIQSTRTSLCIATRTDRSDVSHKREWELKSGIGFVISRPLKSDVIYRKLNL